MQANGLKEPEVRNVKGEKAAVLQKPRVASGAQRKRVGKDPRVYTERSPEAFSPTP